MAYTSRNPNREYNANPSTSARRAVRGSAWRQFAWVSPDIVGIQARLCWAIRSPVTTAITPGTAAALDVSTPLILAWANGLARCWDSMPGVSALAEMVPELVTRVLLPRLFTGLGRPAGEWASLESDARSAVSGFQILRGSFDTAFPVREVAVWDYHTA